MLGKAISYRWAQRRLLLLLFWAQCYRQQSVSPSFTARQELLAVVEVPPFCITTWLQGRLLTCALAPTNAALESLKTPISQLFPYSAEIQYESFCHSSDMTLNLHIKIWACSSAFRFVDRKSINQLLNKCRAESHPEENQSGDKNVFTVVCFEMQLNRPNLISLASWGKVQGVIKLSDMDRY